MKNAPNIQKDTNSFVSSLICGIELLKRDQWLMLTPMPPKINTTPTWNRHIFGKTVLYFSPYFNPNCGSVLIPLN